MPPGGRRPGTPVMRASRGARVLRRLTVPRRPPRVENSAYCSMGLLFCVLRWGARMAMGGWKARQGGLAVPCPPAQGVAMTCAATARQQPQFNHHHSLVPSLLPRSPQRAWRSPTCSIRAAAPGGSGLTARLQRSSSSNQASMPGMHPGAAPTTHIAGGQLPAVQPHAAGSRPSAAGRLSAPLGSHSSSVTWNVPVCRYDQSCKGGGAGGRGEARAGVGRAAASTTAAAGSTATASCRRSREALAMQPPKACTNLHAPVDWIPAWEARRTAHTGLLGKVLQTAPHVPPRAGWPCIAATPAATPSPRCACACSSHAPGRPVCDAARKLGGGPHLQEQCRACCARQVRVGAQLNAATRSMHKWERTQQRTQQRHDQPKAATPGAPAAAPTTGWRLA